MSGPMRRGSDRWPRGWGSRGRPPWWPNDEPFPPRNRQGSEAWREMRRRFFWRAAIALLVFTVLISLAVSFLVTLVTSWMGGQPSFALTGLFYVLIVLLLAAGVRRLFRGTAVPVGDLIEAAGRVEAGDYAVRVRERGPRELRSLAGAFNAMSAQLEETEAQRTRLLADVSHELRTPLTVMQGSLEGILDGLYPADELHLTPILEETRVMSRLIDDLRTLASAEAGSLSLHREPTDLGDLLTDAAAAFRSQADTAGVTIHAANVATLPTLDVDPERIRQVLANLLTNALRHTPRGERIDLAASASPDAITVTVADTGAGMPPEVLDRIFERFYRAPESRGSGLGLPIARELVRAHGGELTAESAPGQGTTLRFTLPTGG